MKWTHERSRGLALGRCVGRRAHLRKINCKCTAPDDEHLKGPSAHQMSGGGAKYSIKILTFRARPCAKILCVSLVGRHAGLQIN